MGVEGTEDCTLGAGRWLGMIDAVHEEGESEDVREQDEFLEVHSDGGKIDCCLRY